MPQAVKIVSQAEEESLAALGKQTAPRSTARQFAFGNGEDSLDQGAAAIFLARKIGTHLRTNAVKGPGLFPALGRDDAQGMQLLTVWLRSESNSASANTQPIGVWAWACATNPGRLAQSFHGA